MAAYTGPTMLEFTKIQFLGKWDRTGDAIKCAYAPLDPVAANVCNLNIVWQGNTGNLKTYQFSVQLNAQVVVNWQTNLVHVPVNCLKEIPGDITKCNG
ncbi:MAG: hypothetical protein K1X86_14180 [Ignavibacteria bacterium]|nr:hypothetical protein [Ignavibacteria bacterium]